MNTQKPNSGAKEEPIVADWELEHEGDLKPHSGAKEEPIVAVKLQTQPTVAGEKTKPISPMLPFGQRLIKLLVTILSFIGLLGAVIGAIWGVVILVLCIAEVRLDVGRIDWDATSKMLGSIFTIPTTVTAALLIAARLGLFKSSVED